MEFIRTAIAASRRDFTIGKLTGCNPFLLFIIHSMQRIRRRLFSRKPHFTDTNGNAVEPRHVFVHSLVVEAERAFRPNADAMHDFESWFVTREEFRAFLTAAWRQGFVLVRARDLFNEDVRLPGGKTPLILSMDDMNYYTYMKGFGFPERVEIDQDGLRYPINTGKERIFLRDGDAPGMLEQFIKSHPDFSHDGARAIIGVTGYEGLLGYRSEKDATSVVRALKSMGYEFACHSWGHHHRIYNYELPDGKKGIVDMRKWLHGVGRVVGNTDLFISPFGIDIRSNPILLRFLEKNGFRYFFSVSEQPAVVKEGRSFFATRQNLDGISLRTRTDEFRHLFCDPECLYDQHRTIPLHPPKDNLSFVAFAKQCLAAETAYVWDGMGEILTHEFLDAKEIAYPDFQSHEKWMELHNRVNGATRGFDCCGLIKMFLMGGFHHYRYRREFDLNAKRLLQTATTADTISSLPEIPGLCLYMDGHTGIYIGNGTVIESTPNERFGNGVVQTRLSDRPWTHWYRCRGVDYKGKRT